WRGEKLLPSGFKGLERPVTELGKWQEKGCTCYSVLNSGTRIKWLEDLAILVPGVRKDLHCQSLKG
nr:hypothetical protein [Tanacetum cinerariifolium]